MNLSNWIKYTFISLLFVAGAIFVFFASVRHQSNVVSTQEVEGALPSVTLGEARVEGISSLDIDSIVTNIMLSIAESHRGYRKNVEIDYVFLDKNDHVTESKENISAIQFEVKLLGKNNRVESTSKQKIELDYLSE